MSWAKQKFKQENNFFLSYLYRSFKPSINETMDDNLCWLSSIKPRFLNSLLVTYDNYPLLNQESQKGSLSRLTNLLILPGPECELGVDDLPVQW